MGRRNPAAEDRLVCAESYPDLISSGLGIELNSCRCRKSTSSGLSLWHKGTWCLGSTGGTGVLALTGRGKDAALGVL